jgi:hypothetical protein
MQGGAVAYAAAVASALGVRACVVTGQHVYMYILIIKQLQRCMKKSGCACFTTRPIDWKQTARGS